MILHDETAECCVLAAALRGPAYALELSERLRAEDFAVAAYSAAWTEIVSRAAAGKPLDADVVTRSLVDAGSLPAASAEIMRDTLGSTWRLARAEAVDEHVATIAALARRRRIRAVAADVGRAAECAEYTPEVVEDYAIERLVALSADRPGARDCSIRSALKAALTGVDARAKGQEPGILTPLPKLNDLTLGLHPTDLVIVAARPSMGKTALAMQLAVHAARRGVPTRVQSLEMGRDALALRMLACEASVDHRALWSGGVKDTDWPKLNATAAALAAMALDVDDDSALSIGEIQARCRRAHSQGRCGLVVVDYLQLARGDGRHGKNGNREQEIGEIAEGLKALAKSINAPVVALSQLNRQLEMRPWSRDPEKNQRRPRLSDLRESGAIEQAADLVIGIYRDAVYSGDANDASAELIVLKQRNGPLGTVTARFRAESVRFEEPAKGWHEEERYP